MSCNKCEDAPIQTYMRVGKADVMIEGCEDHLRGMLRVYRKGLECAV